TLPSSSSCSHEFNEPDLVASRLRTRPHASPEGHLPACCSLTPEASAAVGLSASSNVQIPPRVAESVFSLWPLDLRRRSTIQITPRGNPRDTSSFSLRRSILPTD
ncbi:hypothetical protein PIB30_059156, partial [Stylosanthes scabra]|nr:hypothetical protein [Stylosanthes scabra]